MISTMLWGGSPFVQRLSAFCLATVAFLLVSAAASAQASCTPVHGHITGFAQEPPTCGGQFCSQGTFNGGIQGDYIAATTLNAEQPVPDLFFYTSDTTATVRIGHRQGTLSIKNAGVLSLSGELTELETVTGGTGELTGASGVLIVSGISGEEVGEFTYDGMICVE
jgi:hypothetical protein